MKQPETRKRQWIEDGKAEERDMVINEIKIQIETRNLKSPFTVSYHGESTILVDADGQPVWGQIPRESAEAIAKVICAERCG
jgi:hypothetical protein